jgi:hypothetical protein
VVRENQFRRDRKKAQYEVLGYRFKELSVQDANGTIDRCSQSLSGVRDQKPNVSIVPFGTDVSFFIVAQHFVLGFYFH